MGPHGPNLVAALPPARGARARSRSSPAAPPTATCRCSSSDAAAAGQVRSRVRDPPPALRARAARHLAARVRLPPRRAVATRRWIPRLPRSRAAGIEELLAAARASTTSSSTRHLLAGGTAARRLRRPLRRRCTTWCATTARPAPALEHLPYRPYRVGAGGRRSPASDAIPSTAIQVWSGEHGYPGDGAYLDFHKKRFPGGHRYWARHPSQGRSRPQAALRSRGRRRRARPSMPRHFVGLVERTLLEKRRDRQQAPPVRVRDVRHRAVRPLVVRGPALRRRGARPLRDARWHRGHLGRAHARAPAAAASRSRCPRARGATAAATRCGSTTRTALDLAARACRRDPLRAPGRAPRPRTPVARAAARAAARPGRARAAAARGLRLAVPDHHLLGARLRRAAASPSTPRTSSASPRSPSAARRRRLAVRGRRRSSPRASGATRCSPTSTGAATRDRAPRRLARSRDAPTRGAGPAARACTPGSARGARLEQRARAIRRRPPGRPPSVEEAVLGVPVREQLAVRSRTTR